MLSYNGIDTPYFGPSHGSRSHALLVRDFSRKFAISWPWSPSPARAMAAIRASADLNGRRIVIYRNIGARSTGLLTSKPPDQSSQDSETHQHLPSGLRLVTWLRTYLKTLEEGCTRGKERFKHLDTIHLSTMVETAVAIAITCQSIYILRRCQLWTESLNESQITTSSSG